MPQRIGQEENEMLQKHEIASWDIAAWIVTGLGVLSIWLITSFVIAFTVFDDKIMGLFVLLFVIAPIVFGISCVVEIPRGYTLSEQGIILNRRFADITIYFSRIQAMDVVEHITHPLSIGNGGFFGYTGTFFSRSGEEIIASCTRWRRVVIIKTKTATYVISPERPEEFCQDVKDMVGENELERRKNKLFQTV